VIGQEVLAHPLLFEDVRPARAEGAHDPVADVAADLWVDAAVRCADRAELGHDLLRIPAGEESLNGGPTDQAAHGVSDEVDPRPTLGLGPDQVHEADQTFGGLLDAIRLGVLPEGAGVLVVEPVHPYALGRQLAFPRPQEFFLLAASDTQLVTVLGHQAQHGAFELVKTRLPLGSDSDVRGALVETVERVVHDPVDSRWTAAEPAYVDDRKALSHCFPRYVRRCGVEVVGFPLP
jgi:hypothetical protein